MPLRFGALPLGSAWSDWDSCSDFTLMADMVQWGFQIPIDSAMSACAMDINLSFRHAITTYYSEIRIKPTKVQIACISDHH